MTLIEAKGHNGQLSFDGQFVTIARKGFLARASVGKGQKRLPIGSITAVQFKPAGAVTNGFIQFTISGGNEVRSSFGSQTSTAAHDENSVVFVKKQMADFESFRAAVETAIANQHARPQPATTNLADELTKLSELHASGVLTSDQFESAKGRLLN